MINNRQAGRRRGRGNNNGGGNGGGQRQGGGGGGQGGRDTGNRIDSRARGNASQLYEKYKNLARDAQMQGDRVNIEYYLQFADHYFRVLSEQRTRLEESQPQQAPRPRMQQPFDINGDDDYADEGEPIRAGEQQGEQAQQGGQRQDRDDRPRDDRPREDRPRDERPRYEGQRDGQRTRDDRPRGDRQPREDRPVRDEQPRTEARTENRDDQVRNEQPRDGQRDGQNQLREPRSEYRDARPPRAPRSPAPVQADGEEAQRSDAIPAVNDDAVVEAVVPIEEKPRRRGRPPRDRSADDAVTNTGVDAASDASNAGSDADRLPASLGISAASPAPTFSATDADPEEKPRRRRIRAATSEVQAG